MAKKISNFHGRPLHRLYLAAERSEEHELVFRLIDELCREAGMLNLRESARGALYSIAENAIAECTAWYNMPWED
jgi:hypothetical protein